MSKPSCGCKLTVTGSHFDRTAEIDSSACLYNPQDAEDARKWREGRERITKEVYLLQHPEGLASSTWGSGRIEGMKHALAAFGVEVEK